MRGWWQQEAGGNQRLVATRGWFERFRCWYYEFKRRARLLLAWSEGLKRWLAMRGRLRSLEWLERVQRCLEMLLVMKGGSRVGMR